MTTPVTNWTQFRGGWCDNCRTAYPFIPSTGNCPACGPIKLRPATITVDPDDAEQPVPKLGMTSAEALAGAEQGAAFIRASNQEEWRP